MKTYLNTENRTEKRDEVHGAHEMTEMHERELTAGDFLTHSLAYEPRLQSKESQFSQI
jgi:hypothetical protein